MSVSEAKYSSIEKTMEQEPSIGIRVLSRGNLLSNDNEKAISNEDLEVAEILNGISNTIVSSNTSIPISAFVSHSEIDKTPELVASVGVRVLSGDNVLSSDTSESVHISLLVLITKMISDTELQKKYAIPLDAKYTHFIKQIIQKNPEYFSSVETSLNTIIKDKCISVSDFPEIVKMVMDLYVVLHSICSKDTVDICAGILKLIFFIAVKEKVVVVENENDIINAFDVFIGSIVELLKTHIRLSSNCLPITCDLRKMWGFHGY